MASSAPQSSREMLSPEAERFRESHPDHVPVIIEWPPEKFTKILAPAVMNVKRLHEVAAGRVPPHVLDKLITGCCDAPVTVFDGSLSTWTVRQLDDLYRDARGFLSFRLPESSCARGSEETRQEEASVTPLQKGEKKEKKKEEEEKQQQLEEEKEDSTAAASPTAASSSALEAPQEANTPQAEADASQSSKGSKTSPPSSRPEPSSKETQVFAMACTADAEDSWCGDEDWDAWCEEGASGARVQSVEARHVTEVHPDHVPVHCQEANTVPPNIKKLLVPATKTVQECERIVYEILRGDVPDQARDPIRLFVGNLHLKQPDQLMKDVFSLYKSRTGLLHTTVKFGAEDEENERLQESLRGAQACLDLLQEQLEKEKWAKDVAEQQARDAQSECIDMQLALQQLASEGREKDELTEALQAQNASLQAQLQAHGQERESEEGEKPCKEEETSSISSTSNTDKAGVLEMPIGDDSDSVEEEFEIVQHEGQSSQ